LEAPVSKDNWPASLAAGKVRLRQLMGEITWRLFLQRPAGAHGQPCAGCGETANRCAVCGRRGAGGGIYRGGN